jgi:hypothetical protein
MTPKEQLEELNVYMENAVDQISRCQRMGRDGSHGIADFDSRIDKVFADIVSLRNDVRAALMRELSRGPKKLPTV